MKAILEFTLPDEQEDLDMAQKGSHYLSVIQEMDNFLRGKLKYSELTDEQAAVYTEIRSMLHSLRYEE